MINVVTFKKRTLFCPHNNEIREKMLDDLSNLESKYNFVWNSGGDMFMTLIGKRIIGVDSATMIEFWMIAGTAINRMYLEVTEDRDKTGVG